MHVSNRIACLAVVLAFTGLGAITPLVAQPSAEIIEQGRKIATENCARCHAIGSEGKSTHKDAPPFRDVAKRYPVWSLAEALAEGISTGHPDMPEFRFNPKEITSLLSYLETLEDNHNNPPAD